MSDVSQTHASLAPSSAQKFRQRFLPFLVFGAILLLIPMTDPSRTMYALMHQMAIYIVFALAYNMLLGKGACCPSVTRSTSASAATCACTQ